MDDIAYAAHAFTGGGDSGMWGETQVEGMHNLTSCQNVNFADMMSVSLSLSLWPPSLSSFSPCSISAHLEFINHTTDGDGGVAYLRLTRRTHFLNMATRQLWWR